MWRAEGRSRSGSDVTEAGINPKWYGQQGGRWGMDPDKGEGGRHGALSLPIILDSSASSELMFKIE